MTPSDHASMSTDLPATPPDVALTMVSQTRYLSSARGAVSAFARQAGFDDSASSHIALAVDEALCNVIRHGYDKREDGVIWLKFWPVVEQGQVVGVRLVIEDEAKQVDPDAIHGRDLADIRPGGLGVHIIREVMDAVKYEPRPGPGMRLTMIRRLPSAGSRVTFGSRQDAAGNGTNPTARGAGAQSAEPQRGKST